MWAACLCFWENNVYAWLVGVARYMYSYRTVTVRASRFGAWCLTKNTGNSPNPEGGAAVMQRCLEPPAPAEEQRMPWVAHLKTMYWFWTRLSHDKGVFFKGLRTQLFEKWSFVLVYPTSLIRHKSKYSIIFPYLQCTVSEC